MPLTLSRVRAIKTVAMTGSYAAAARVLALSQPSIAQQIKGVEAEYRVQLFQRSNGTLHPTPLCAQLCDVAERIAEEERAAERILTRHSTLADGRISIGLGNSMPGMALIAQFRRRHPGVAISVETGSYEKIVKAVLSREVEIGVLPDVPADGRFRTELLVRQDVVAIVNSRSRLSGRKRVECAELMQQPMIFRTRGSSTQRVVDRAFRRAGLTPLPLMTLDTRDAVYEAVANKLGVGFMWRHGTGRTDAVRRVEVAEMHTKYDEVAFALADENTELLNAFMATVRAVRKTRD